MLLFSYRTVLVYSHIIATLITVVHRFKGERIQLIKNSVKMLAYRVQQTAFPLPLYPFVALITVLTTHVLHRFNDSF